jgi:phosphopantetheinyl transferase
MDAIARRWLSADEYRAIRRAPTENAKAELFFAGWTSAEATAKATGAGLWGARRSPDGVSCTVFQPEPGFIAAVAADESTVPADESTVPADEITVAADASTVATDASTVAADEMMR